MKKKYMIKFLFPLILTLACVVGYGQAISIPQLNDTPQSLVSTLLNNSCVEVSNIDLSSQQSVAYFTNNGGNFPIGEGVVIRSGNVSLTEGVYSGQGLSSQINNNSDPDLVQINQASGQPTVLTDVAFLEFDFVPLSSNFSFNFLFASNEYGQWQCVSSDVFAILLTNLNTGQTTNLAVIPSTNTPVSVKNIKDDAYNNSCSSDNANLFDTYTVNNPQNSAVNMRGYTKLMTASSNITPGTPYKIRLVIADSNDSSFDSALFIEAGSFSADLDLGENKSICAEDSYTLSTKLDISEYNHSWTYNGQAITSANLNSINASLPGIYGVTITKQGTNCLISDQLEIKELTYNSPANMEECYDPSGSYSYDLTTNNSSSLSIDNQDYEVHYFNSINNANNLQPIPFGNTSNYPSAGNETIYIRLYNTKTGNYCGTIDSFNLEVSKAFGVNQPDPIGVCIIPGEAPVTSLRQAESLIFNAQLSSANLNSYSFTYYASELDARNQVNELTNVEEYEIPISVNSKTIWVRIDSSSTSCYEIVSVEFVLNTPPPVAELNNVIECESYILPSITNGNFYTKKNGGGQQLPIGFEITKSQTIYIFNGPDANGCVNQSKFRVEIAKSYNVKNDHCGSFKTPNPIAGKFYTAPGGPNGMGTLIPAKSILYTSQTIWYYAEVDGVFCTEKSFDINILPLPPVDTPNDIITCGGYTLPNLNNGSYFTQPEGEGQQLSGGDVISKTQEIYVYNDDGTCTNEHMFKVVILPEFTDLVICGDYELPALEIGAYYTQPQGQGQQIPANTIINKSQTIYYYAETTSTPNCTNNTSFYLEIRPIPQVDSLKDVILCKDDVLTLPPLTHGNYYTKKNGKGKMLPTGHPINESIKIYIYNEDNGCSSETSFEVKVRDYPEVSNFTDVYECNSYELPEIENGKYYTASLKQGQELFPGDFITETQVIYIYNEYDDLKGCYKEDSFTIYIEGIKIEEKEDVYACYSYTLPTLEEGNYFTESGGNGQKLYAGEIINSTQKLYIYAENGSRFFCEKEISFNINITLPTLEKYNNIEKCGSYTLETTSQEGYNLNYYWKAGAQNLLTHEDLTFNLPGIYTVYIYAESKENPDCYVEKAIDITIYERPQLYVEGGTICRDALTGEVISPFYLISGLDPVDFEVKWYLNNQLMHKGPEYEAVESGEYYVEVEKVNPEIGSDCNYSSTTVTVLESAKPIAKAKVTEPFKDDAHIVVEIVKGYGEYEYQLDGGEFKSDREFYDVKSGPHQIVIRGIDGKGCGVTVLEVDVIKYPKFFTPNQDGINDTWNIHDLELDRNATVSIYNRYGKLITRLKTSGKGWDGVYNSKNLPSTDYWFVVDYTYKGEERKFKSHFTLKR